MFVVQFVVRPRGQPFDRFGERQLVDLLHEADDVAALTAAETVPEAAGRCDVERRRALVVKRTEPLDRTAACALQRDVLADHIGDRRNFAHARDVAVRYPAGHAPSLSRRGDRHGVATDPDSRIGVVHIDDQQTRPAHIDALVHGERDGGVIWPVSRR